MVKDTYMVASAQNASEQNILDFSLSVQTSCGLNMLVATCRLMCLAAAILLQFSLQAGMTIALSRKLPNSGHMMLICNDDQTDMMCQYVIPTLGVNPGQGDNDLLYPQAVISADEQGWRATATESGILL